MSYIYTGSLSPSIHPSIHLSIYLSIYLSIHPSIHLSLPPLPHTIFISPIFYSSQLHIHSFFTNDDKFLLRKPDTERSKSGYPILAPSSFSLSHAIVNIIHQLQDKEGWKQAISRTMKQRYVLS